VFDPDQRLAVLEFGQVRLLELEIVRVRNALRPFR
jgi:hypothetical protein